MDLIIKQLHEQNLKLFSTYRDLEGKLIDSLQEFDKHRGFQKLGYSSLYNYCRQGLGMSEGQAFTLIRVSRKSVEVPALKEAVINKEITLSSAKLISAVITKENQTLWIEKAKTLPKPALERELVRVNPRAVKNDRFVALTDSLSEARGILSEEARKILERVKEIESRRRASPCNLDAAIIAMGRTYLHKNDPVQRAERARSKIFERSNRESKANKSKNLLRGPERQSASEPTVPRVQFPSEPTVPRVQFPSEATVPRVQFPSEPTVPRVQFPSEPTVPRVQSAKIPMPIVHRVNLRDKGQCQALRNGGICGSRHFTHLHHIIHRSNGGGHTLDNLITLCAGHHRSIHTGGTFSSS